MPSIIIVELLLLKFLTLKLAKWIFLIFWWFLRIGQVASGLPELKLPPMQTSIGDQTLYFTDMITHVGSSILALPLISILESIAVAKAFCKHFSSFFLYKKCTTISDFNVPFFCSST